MEQFLHNEISSYERFGRNQARNVFEVAMHIILGAMVDISSWKTMDVKRSLSKRPAEVYIRPHGKVESGLVKFQK